MIYQRKIYRLIALITFFFVVLFSGCTKEIELEVPQKEPRITVNCFFTDAETWQVKVSKTFDFNENKPVEPIVNTIVKIETNSGETIVLRHKENGVYVSDYYPKEGVEYSLFVEVDGYETICAQSSIPEQSTISDIEIDSTLQTVISNYNIYADMVSVGFTINPPLDYDALCRVRILKFDSIQGYKRYYFDENGFKNMLALGVEKQVVNSLQALKGQIIFGPIWNTLVPIIGEINTSNNLSEIEDATFLDEIDYRDPNAFWMEECISSSGIFYQAPYETYTLLGDFKDKIQTKVYTREFYDREYWLEFQDMSNEFYRFQKDYSLQLSNRGNLNAPPVFVYSNIENGVGIFAGYRKQMFRIR